jgi:hypothetical protein
MHMIAWAESFSFNTVQFTFKKLHSCTNIQILSQSSQTARDTNKYYHRVKQNLQGQGNFRFIQEAAPLSMSQVT